MLFIILFTAILFSSYFSAIETSLMKINHYRLKNQVNQGNKLAKKIDKLLEKTEDLIIIILVGNNISNTLAASVATVIGIKYGDLGIAISTGFLTIFMLLFSEIFPKTLATLYPEKVAFSGIFILVLLKKIMYPIILIINFFIKILMKLFQIKFPSNRKEILSKEELRTIFTESKFKMPRKNKEMLVSILDLEKLTVNDIMIPRNEIVGIDINEEWKSIVKKIVHFPYGRIVLYRKNLDHTIGILKINAAFRLMIEKQKFNKENLLRATDEIHYIPEGTTLNIQLFRFQISKQKIGIIVDEYGSVQGIVTMEDILEEIVGNFTTSVSSSMEEINLQKDGSCIVDGSISIKDLNKRFKCNFPNQDASTINGMILEILEDIPKVNTSIQIEKYRINILEVERNMIKRVQIIPNK
ncbi:CNNM domain-containing protein [bacterium endosymbiont of Pedicinus badii]|uniref:CNNM domain-containing protein n=1 Tax=bacterium endosymbiont of Pedicinus badii TaxID=1719126 RepID=UPI0009BA53FB|nr:CNNM domain-containing protein [bacterium endosymbiont of Pedicinus badii]OQM34248.1 hypothetical protein AOQ89_02870 [bacterium endosymbiont of Pedicinus badii]